MQGNLSLRARIDAFSLLGKFLAQHQETDAAEALVKLNAYFLEGYQNTITEAGLHNAWFERSQMVHALSSWAELLKKENLEAWVARYREADFEPSNSKTVALIMAGNIPLVGFHDMLSVLLSGHKVLVKPSSDDNKMLPFIAQVLVAIERGFAERILFADGKMTDFDAVIATGSNNSSRYFEQYFAKYPHIIRKNRSSIAILKGEESEADIEALGADVFTYFGMGCRNVTKLYMPEGFNTDRIFEGFFKYAWVGDNNKYNNNYTYHRAIYLMEQHKFLDNGFVMLKAHEDIHAPVSVVYYSYYKNTEELEQLIEKRKDEIQCIVGNAGDAMAEVPFGKAQKPALWDYADKVDTIKFLRSV